MTNAEYLALARSNPRGNYRPDAGLIRWNCKCGERTTRGIACAFQCDECGEMVTCTDHEEGE